MKIKKTQISFFPSLLLCVFFLLTLSFCTKADSPKQDYGVFLGIGGNTGIEEKDKESLQKLKNYRMVVLEPTNFSPEQIREIKADGTKVYGYLNIGALENFRPYYEDFKKDSLAPYENWEEEYWIDVSNPQWQDFLINDLGQKYSSIGIDGFFLDNTDIYYQYPQEEIYQGLKTILTGLKQYSLPLILNGGDTFVQKSIEDGKALSLFDGVNQECVFTKIDFTKPSYLSQDKETKAYYEEYLEKAKTAGLSVYLTEYHANSELSQEIERYCKENGFLWYNAESLELR